MIEEIYQCKKLVGDDIWRTKKGIALKLSGLVKKYPLKNHKGEMEEPPHKQPAITLNDFKTPITIQWIVKGGRLSPLAQIVYVVKK